MEVATSTIPAARAGRSARPGRPAPPAAHPPQPRLVCIRGGLSGAVAWRPRPQPAAVFRPARRAPPAAAASAGASAAPTAAAATDARAGPVSDADLARFQAWADSAGCACGNTRIGRVPEGLGLVATRAIAAGDAVAAVPESRRLSAASAAACGVVGPHISGLKPWVALALHLCHQGSLGEASPWASYLRLLPATPGGSLLWSTEDKALLAGSQLGSSTAAYRAYVDAEFPAFAAAAAAAGLPQKSADAAAFDWAFCVLRSRALPPCEGAAIALAPYLDLVNHRRDRTATWEARKSGLLGSGEAVLGLWADRAYAPGEQVFCTYGGPGGKTGSQLALDFGFCDPPASDAGAGFFLSLSLPEGDRFFDDKADVAESAGLGASPQFLLQAGSPPPSELKAFLRLMNLGGRDAFLLEALFRSTAWETMLSPVSEANESLVCASMTAGCRDALAGYAGGAATDIALLAGGGLGAAATAAVRARLGERLALEATRDYFETVAGGLARLEFYQERRLKSLRLLDETGKSTYEEEIESMFRVPGMGPK